MKLNIKDILKKKSAKVAIVAVAIISTIATMSLLRPAQTETSALKETSPFYATEYYDSLFYVEGYGDLNVYVLRKGDGTNSGPLGWCLNKNKIMPINESIPYENFTGSMNEWEWELINGKYPTETQVANVQRALYGYKFLFPNVMDDFGLEPTDNMSLYHAMQVSAWSILENWTPSDVKIKDDVKNNPELLALAEKIHSLYTEMYRYGTNASNKTYVEGIKVVLDNTNNHVETLTVDEKSYVQGDVRGYYRSPLIEAVPNQIYGYYSKGEYAFTYKVELKNAPEGSRVVNENGKPQDTFSTEPGVGLEFYIEVPVDTVGNKTGNFEATVSTTSFRRNAPMLWTPVSDTAYQAILQDVTIPDSDVKSFTINYKGSQVLGSVVVNKTGEMISGYNEVDSDFGKVYQPKYTQKPLSHTSFDLYFKYDDMIFTGTDGYEYFDGDKVQQESMTTDASGKVVFNNVPMDADADITEYTVKETATQVGWIINGVEQVVKIDKTKGTTGTINFENKRVEVDFKFTKYQETSNGKVPLEGAVFGIYASQDISGGIKKDSLVGLLVTDKNGVADGLTANLPVGYKFYVKELKTNENLVLDKATYYLDTNIVDVDEDVKGGLLTVYLKDASGNVVTEMTNLKKRASLTVLKQEEKLNEQTNEKYYLSISDAGNYEFKVYSDKEKTNLVATLNKDTFKDGKFTVDKLELGTYYVEETAANGSYKLNTKLQEIKLEYGKENLVTFQNDINRGNLEIVKKEERYNSSTNKYTYEVITSGKGYEFEVYYGKGTTPIATVNESNYKDGKFVLTNLYPGNYKVVETKSGEAYELNIAEHTTTVKANKTATVEVKNELKADGLTIVKQEERYNTTSKKFEFMNITNAEGYEFQVYSDAVKRTLVATVNAENFENGKFVVTNLKPGKYYVVETKAPTPFIINEKTFEIEVKFNQTNEITITNAVDTFTVKLYKKDDTKANNIVPLKDVIFDLAYEGNVLYQSVTDKDGVATFENVKRGITYEIVEHVPAGYKASEETLKIATDEVTRLWEATIYNKKIDQFANISFLKVDSKTNKPLAGATVGLYRKSDTGFENPIKVDVTNAEGRILFEKLNIEEEYVLREQIAPKGYFLAENIEVSLADLSNGDTKEVVMKDEQYFGYIKLIKTDSVTEVPVSGAKYGLYDKGMKLIAEGITNENGEYVFENQPVGDYFVKEIQAPKGYRLNEEAYKAVLSDIEKEGIEVKVQDVAYDITLKIIKVDNENRNLLLPGAGFALYSESDTELTNPLFMGTTGEDGQILFENLPLGKYVVVEEVAPEGYTILTQKILLDLTDVEDKAIVTLTVYNEKIKEEVDIDPELPVDPEPTPNPEPTPDPEPEPTPEPQPDPEPSPEPEPEPQPDPIIPEPERPNSDPEPDEPDPTPTIKVENPDTGVENEKPSWMTISGIVAVVVGIGLAVVMFLKNKKK